MIANGSANTVAASAKATPCLDRLRAAFRMSHSNSINSDYRGAAGRARPNRHRFHHPVIISPQQQAILAGGFGYPFLRARGPPRSPRAQMLTAQGSRSSGNHKQGRGFDGSGGTADRRYPSTNPATPFNAGSHTSHLSAGTCEPSPRKSRTTPHATTANPTGPIRSEHSIAGPIESCR